MWGAIRFAAFKGNQVIGMNRVNINKKYRKGLVVYRQGDYTSASLEQAFTWKNTV